MTDSHATDPLDAGVATRLRDLAASEAESTSPWPGLDRAVRRGRLRRAAAGGTLTVLCAATAWLVVPFAMDGLDRTAPIAGPVTSTNTPTQEESETMSVADYFAPPELFPGPTWTRYGELVDGLEINSIADPEHCDWQSAVMMHLGWPLGTVSTTSDEIRQFIRDPQGAISAQLQAGLRSPDLPADAEDTGYRLAGLQLWLSPSDPGGAYLVSALDVERWPRADPLVACG